MASKNAIMMEYYNAIQKDMKQGVDRYGETPIEFVARFFNDNNMRFVV